MSANLQTALCGLTFFAMAIAVWQRATDMPEESKTGPFLWLAAAGGLHAAADLLTLLEVSAPWHGTLAAASEALFASSLAAFMQFGIGLQIAPPSGNEGGQQIAQRQGQAVLRLLPAALFTIWVLLGLTLATLPDTVLSPSLLGRIMLGIPAMLCCAVGLLRLARQHVGSDARAVLAAKVAAVAFLIYTLQQAVAAFSQASPVGAAGASGEDLGALPGLKLAGALICLVVAGSTVWLLKRVNQASRRRLRDAADGAHEELQRAVQKLKDSELRSRTLLEAAPMPLAVIRGRAIRYANSRAHAMLGLGDGELQGRTLADFFVERDEYDRLLDRLDRDSDGASVELSLRSPDGSAIWVLLSIVPITDEGEAALFTGWVDISKRKRAEQKLRESQLRFQDYADIATDWYWETDVEHRFTMLAGSAAADAGITPSFLLGRDRTQILESRVSPENIEAYRRLLDRHEPFRDYRYSVTRDSGTSLVISSSGRPLTDEQGNFIGYRGVARDVTEQDRLEQRIVKSEQRYRSLIETSLVGIFIFSEDWRPLLVNDAGARLFGYETASELMALDSAAGLVEPQEVERLTEYRRARLRGEDAPPLFEFQGRHRDGSTICLLCNSKAIEWEGTPGVHTMVIDITERKRAEEALRNSERQLRLIADALPAMIFYLDKALRFRFVSKMAESWYARSRDGLIGKHVSELIGAERYARWEAEYAAVLAGSTVSIELTLPFADGVTRVVQGDFLPHRDEEGNVQGLFGLVVDLTERRALEDSLRQAQKMEAVGQLTGGIAHDFNNLLGVILGNAEILRQMLPEEPQTPRKALEMIERAGERGASLTRQLLAFSRRQTLAPKTVKLDAIVDGMTELMRRTLGDDIIVTTRHAEPLWNCRADPTQLESAILNLALNSRDAMPAGGEITIETLNLTREGDSVTSWKELPPGDYVELRVSDTGDGMPQEVVQRAFEPFFTTKDVGRGTGLGLSMVYGFVRQSGGQIRIESTPGHGTTVRLCLPRSAANAGTSGRTETPVTGRADGETVLLVEDNDDLRVSIARMLDEMGYAVTSAADARSALTALKSGQHYDLLLTDIVMPGETSGASLAQEAEACQPGICVILMSGYSHDSELASLEANNLPFLQKPFRRNELEAKLAEARTSRKRPGDPHRRYA